MSKMLSELLIKIIAQPDQAFNTILDTVHEKISATIEEIETTSKKVKELSGNIAVSLSGVSVAGTVLIGSWAKAAGEMEIYKTKLTTVLKSSELATSSLSKAVDFAASTPFDISGVVNASVQLQVYGQNAEKWLPYVGDLSAGMGKRIEETSLVIGKALSGSAEGVESLRNEFGVSSAKLQKYGAEMNSAGGISVNSAANVEKFRTALQKIVALEFGGAMERQSKTWQGAMSNLGDSFDKLKVSLGQELVPSLTAVARGITSTVEGFNKYAGALKPLIAWGAAGATAMAVLGAGIAGLTAVLPLGAIGWVLLRVAIMNYVRTAAIGTIANQAYTLAMQSMNIVVARLTSAFPILSGFYARFTLMVNGSITVIYKAIVALMSLSNAFWGSLGVVGAVGLAFSLLINKMEKDNEKKAGILAKDEKAMASWRTVTKKYAGQSAEDLMKMGVTAKDLEEDIVNMQEAMQKAGDEGNGKLVKFFKNTVIEAKALQEELKKIERKYYDFTRAIKDVVIEYGIMKETGGFFEEPKKEIDYLIPRIKELQKKLNEMNIPSGLGFKMDFTDTKGIEATIRSLKYMQAEYQKVLDDPAVKEPAKASIKVRSDAIKEMISLYEQGREAGKKANEKHLQDQKDYISKQKDLNKMNLDDEIKANERMLQNKNLEAEQRKEIEINIAKLKHDKMVESRENAERSLQKELDAVKLMTSGQVKEYDRIIAKIKEKKDAQQLTEKQAYDLNKTTSEARKTAAEKDEKERYESMAKAQEAYLQVIDKNEEMSVETRLGYIESLGRFWEKMQREKVVTAEQAEDQIRKLIEKRAALEKAAIDANKAAEKDLIALRKQALDYDIGKLKEQLKGGGDAEAQLTKKMQERMDLELKSIDEKARKMEKESVAPERRGEATAREKASLYEKQADELDQMIQQLMQEKFDETDRLGSMQRDSLVSSLRGRKDQYTGWAKTASAQAEDFMKQAEAKGLNTPQALTGFEVPIGVFSSSVEKFRDVITQLERVFNQGVQSGISVPSSANFPMTPRSAGSQVNTNIYNVGGKGFTPTAEIEHKWGGLAQAIQKMQDNGYLGSIGGSLSY